MSLDRVSSVAGLIASIVVVTASAASAYTVTLTANPTTLTEPGGTVEYTLTQTCVDRLLCHNHGVSDSFGPVGGEGTCVTFFVESPELSPTPGSYSCTYSRPVSGVAGDTVTNTVTVDEAFDAGEPGCSGGPFGGVHCEKTASASVTIQAPPSSGGGGGSTPCAQSSVKATVGSISGCAARRIASQFSRQSVNGLSLNDTGGSPDVPDARDLDSPDDDVPSVEEIEAEVKEKLKGLP